MATYPAPTRTLSVFNENSYEEGSLATTAVGSGNKTNYGDLIVDESGQIVQTYHLYGVPYNTNLYQYFSGSGGTITASTSGDSALLNITTTVGSYSVLRSKRVVKLIPGRTSQTIHRCTFTTPTALSLQFVGVGNSNSDAYFCYNGTSFGIRTSTGGSIEVRKLTINVAENSVRTGIVTLNGVAYNVALTNAGGTTAFTAHQCEIGSTFGDLWEVEHIGSTVIFVASAVGARSGAYSFSSPGVATGTFTQMRAGSALTTAFVAQSAWNGTTPSGFNPQVETEYCVEYSRTCACFKLLTPSGWQAVHTVDSPGFTAPNMYAQVGIASLGSSTALSLNHFSVSSVNTGLNDPQKLKMILPNASVFTSKSISAGVETVILVLSNRLQLNGIVNQSEILLNQLSISTDGTKSVILKIIKNPTTIGANTTADYSNETYYDEAQSLVLYDTTADTYAGGIPLVQFILPKVDAQTIDLAQLGFYLSRDDVILVSCLSTASSDIILNISASEDY